MNLCPLKQGLPRRTAERCEPWGIERYAPRWFTGGGPLQASTSAAGPVGARAYRQLRTLLV